MMISTNLWMHTLVMNKLVFKFTTASCTVNLILMKLNKERVAHTLLTMLSSKKSRVMSTSPPQTMPIPVIQ